MARVQVKFELGKEYHVCYFARIAVKDWQILVYDAKLRTRKTIWKELGEISGDLTYFLIIQAANFLYYFRTVKISDN